MNTIYGIILIVGLFSNLTGYFIGFIRGKINTEEKEAKAFKSGYIKAFRDWMGFEPIEPSVEEAYFEWKNKLARQKENYHH